MKQNPIIRIGVKFLVPFIILFALYVQFHGDLGPGGGFQAGVIMASVVVIYSLIFGSAAAEALISLSVVRSLVPTGVLIYAGVGLFSLIRGHNYLDYSALHIEAAAGQHIGIFIVELAVFITVFASMTAIFYAFIERQRRNEDDPE